GESLEESAKRELREEVGLQATSWELLMGGFQTSNSICREVGFLFVARDLQWVGASPEETEKIQVRRIPLEVAFRMVEQGQFRDSLTIAGLLALQVRRLRGLERGTDDDEGVR
ncbi:MAG: NUDIX hydrolase, partial [Verrucomicrobiota bacterium]